MIYVLPGMGADGRMYGDAWRTLTDCSFINWPVYDGEQSIAALALKVIAEQGIQSGDVVVGTSLGGIVACEIANRVSLKRLVVISGAIRKEEIRGLLAGIHPLIDLAPIKFVQKLAGILPSELARMFSQGDPAFMRDMCRAIFTWTGLNDQKVGLVRIHGKSDAIIPIPANVDHMPPGGHLVAITHAKQCVQIVKKSIEAMGG